MNRMRISYEPLWKMLLDRDMTKKDLREQKWYQRNFSCEVRKGREYYHGRIAEDL